MSVFDIETFGNNTLTPYCCCLYYNKKYVVFYGLECIEKFIKYIFNVCRNETIIYAHNLTFDGSLILSKLPKDVKINNKNTLIIRGSIYSLRLDKNNVSIILKCSYKIIPLSLSELGKKINMEKLEIDHNKININSYITYKNDVITYCKRDVEVTQYVLNKIYSILYITGVNWKYFTTSISGISIAVFRKNFKNKDVVLSVDRSIDIALRSAYYGGRCEVFGNPEDGDYIFHYDFSSMYANRLREKYPCGNPVFVLSIENIDRPGFYSVKVKSNNLDIPILPYRGEKLIFPNGVFSGVYWYEELKLFVENGGVILKINWGYVYDEEKYIFEEFAKYCIDNRGSNEISKIIWNRCRGYTNC